MVNKYSFLASHLARLAKYCYTGSCLGCNQAISSPTRLCAICEKILKNQKLKRLDCCLLCSLPLDIRAAGNNSPEPGQISLPSFICGKCQTKKPYFDRCVAATRYSALPARLINGLKHYQRLAAVDVITKQMVAAVNPRAETHHPLTDSDGFGTPLNFDLMIPVPLHRERLRARGFNQAAEIAKPLSRHFEIPLGLQLCQRTQGSLAQQQLTGAKREKNLHNAFTASPAVAGLRIVVVDDVVTTTATANAVAKSLIRAGAIGCEIWCFARTPRPANSRPASTRTIPR